ncbi:hypothetical protein BC628DRAFT_345932 [Trametes gibbosa]|nr:hypothetical protein BC628DRAFT_345932 [Trametes gibbosa]
MWLVRTPQPPGLVLLRRSPRSISHAWSRRVCIRDPHAVKSGDLQYTGGATGEDPVGVTVKGLKYYSSGSAHKDRTPSCTAYFNTLPARRPRGIVLEDPQGDLRVAAAARWAYWTKHDTARRGIVFELLQAPSVAAHLRLLRCRWTLARLLGSDIVHTCCNKARQRDVRKDSSTFVVALGGLRDEWQEEGRDNI